MYNVRWNILPFSLRRDTLYIFLAILICEILIAPVTCKKEGEKPAWTKKDVRDYNDADLERLFEQWEEDEEPLEPDELPEHLRAPPPIDFSKVDPSNPEALLRMSKKGKSLMMFATVTGKPNKVELEEVTKIWQTSLMNNHIPSERFVIDERRVIFMFKDGSLAWEAKDFIIEQERCAEVTIENKSYPGKHSGKKSFTPSEEKMKSKEEL